MPRQFGVPEEVIRTVVSRQMTASAYGPYMSPIHDKHVIGVNNVYQIGDWIDVIFFGDCSWYLFHRPYIAKWPKLKVTCCNRFASRTESQSEGVKYLPKDTTKSFGISSNPSTVSWNSNSGAAAISLAAHLGVKRIILLGFDMSLDGHKVSHWHGPHNPQKNAKPTKPPFARHLKGFPAIASDAAARGIEILNACPESAITVFPKINLKDIL